MKDTVLAVHEIVADSENDYATVKEIARALEIGDQATYDRVSRAQVAGLLENVSEGRKKKLRVAGELPEGTTFLPSVEAIRAFAARTPLGGLGVSEESSQTRMDKGSTSSDVHSETDRRSGNSTNLRNASEETSEIANPHGDRDPSVTSEAPTAPRDMGTDGTQENLDQEPGWLARSLEEDQDEGEDPYERA
jgi:transposase-like protein